jgi:hypothetical protein
MYTIAAIGGGTVPAAGGGRGGTGSKGATSAHSSSGTSSSARVVMARDHARPAPKERNAVLVICLDKWIISSQFVLIVVKLQQPGPRGGTRRTD